MAADRRMIEEQIPLAAVNYASSKEKKHPRRHVELIHQWPARRPRSAARVAVAAALLGAPDDPAERERRLKLLSDLAPYECSQGALEEARRLIRKEHGGRAPRVLDLFAGGGAIPLEAANLGCQAHAVELNPVAHLIELATCVYPQTYGKKLADLVARWGKVVLDRATSELSDLYPAVRVAGNAPEKQLSFAHGGTPEGELLVHPIAYLWTRTVPCVNPACGAAVPLVRQTWLCKKESRAIAMKLVAPKGGKAVRFEIVSASSPSALGFDPEGHSERGDAECPFCGAAVSANQVKAYGQAGRIGVQLMAMAGLVDGERGRVYLPAESVPVPSEAALKDRLAAFGDGWPGPARLALAPEFTGGSCLPYGFDEFWKLFTDRQAVALLTFSRAIREAHPQILAEVHDAALARAVVTYLALAVDRCTDYGNVCCAWEPQGQIAGHIMARQAIPMVWDFTEIVPTASITGSAQYALPAVAEAIEGLTKVPGSALCVRTSATALSTLADNSLDAVVTDPPYSDYISYADLSDFFFVWLKRTIGDLYPEHFGADRTPKKQEATVVPYRHGGDANKARAHYEQMMTAAFREAGRVLKPGGPFVVVYAHKSVAGWASLVEALRNARCEVREAWPLATEAKGRQNAQDTAALATSIFLAARKRTEEKTCQDYDEEVLPAVRRVVDERIRTLWDGGLHGADLVIATVGAALGPFTAFATVRRGNGAEVATAEFLEEAQRLVLDAVLRQLLRAANGPEEDGSAGRRAEGDFGGRSTEAGVSIDGIDPISRLYAVARVQFGEAPAESDTFKNLAIGALPPGTELFGARGALTGGAHALLGKKGSKITLRGFEERGDAASLGLPRDGKPAPVVDVLHRLLWLQKHRAAEAPAFLQESGADVDAVRLLAQALGGRPLRAEPTPGAQRDERTAEQRAIDTLLASFGDLTRNAPAGPLFEAAARRREA